MFKEHPENSEHARYEYAKSLRKIAESGFSSFALDANASDYRKLLGAPLDRKVDFSPSLSQEFVGSDEICEIFRLRITALSDLPFFGLLFVPKTHGERISLVLAAHGHLGTPELMYGMHGKNGYSDIIARLINAGFCVFAPQLLIWNYGFNPAKPHYTTVYDREALDSRLKAHGGGIVALELFCILQSITALGRIHTLDLCDFGVCGMSYGAFYTMRAMAIDDRIKRGYFMSCFDGGLNENFPEWFVREKELTPRDGEVAAMCAPRPIYIEVGEHDDIFPPEGAKREAVTTYRRYKNLGAADSFNFRIWNGAHLVNPDNTGIGFLRK